MKLSYVLAYDIGGSHATAGMVDYESRTISCVKSCAIDSNDRDFDGLLAEGDQSIQKSGTPCENRFPSSFAETQWLLDLAAGNGFIQGVVGWAPIAAADFPQHLDVLRKNPLLKGLRHVVQGEERGFLDGEAFNRGIAAMRETGLVYDVLILAHQLDEATRFVDRHPSQLFVLDHIAKPDIVNNQIGPWSTSLRALARRENVVCKLSGMVTAEIEMTRV